MTDFTTGWHRREFDARSERNCKWPVWKHPATPLLIAQNPHGLFNVYNGLHCVARNINGFLRARLAVGRLMRCGKAA